MNNKKQKEDAARGGGGGAAEGLPSNCCTRASRHGPPESSLE